VGRGSEEPKKGATAQSYAATRDWPGYFGAVAGREPRETLMAALEMIGDVGDSAPLALDLGAGEGRDTAELLRRGWRVVAVEPHEDGVRRMLKRGDLAHPERLEIVRKTFDVMELPRARLVNASFSLPFCPPACFAKAWEKVRAAIEPGGWFCGQLFGDRDTWASIADRSHQTRDEALALLEGLTLERFEEEEREGEDCAATPKHWHIFHVIARNPVESGGEGS